jgi:hypothetical protein
VSSDVVRNCCICWFSRIFLLGIFIFKGLTARRLYKSFDVKGLNPENSRNSKLLMILIKVHAVYTAVSFSAGLRVV